jgi:hypothetical protein
MGWLDRWTSTDKTEKTEKTGFKKIIEDAHEEPNPFSVHSLPEKPVEEPKEPEEKLDEDLQEVLDKPETTSAPPPEPNLNTKPEDIISYCFGFVCPEKHIQEMFEAISVDGFKQRRACKKCGKLSEPCIVRQIAEARWECLNLDTIIMFRMQNLYAPPAKWGWDQSGYGSVVYGWNKFEFVSYLEPKTPILRKRKKNA